MTSTFECILSKYKKNANKAKALNNPFSLDIIERENKI
jgi:hypothetical protein